MEAVILKIFKQFEKSAEIEPEFPVIRKRVHCQLLKDYLRTLPQKYECLDASRTWIVYWVLHSLSLLNDMPDAETLSDVVKFLTLCQHDDGGYGGGPGQYPHLGTTYAAVNALSIIGTEEAYNSLDRSSLQKFLWTVRDVDGSFALHKGGEQDIRGAYCAVSIAKITNTYTDALFDKTAEWIVSCQTYEGGFAGCPGMEAHGGYAFCGIASLALLNKTHLCDVDALLRWCVNRQMRLEGGFQGRTNKLVDGCYSFWLGAAFPIISAILSQGNLFDNNVKYFLFIFVTSVSKVKSSQQQNKIQIAINVKNKQITSIPTFILANFTVFCVSLVYCMALYAIFLIGNYNHTNYFLFSENKELLETVLFNQGALQEYVIICCQALPGGGFIDKPGK